MINEELQRTMQGEWQKVRKSFYFPQLPQPKLVDTGKKGSTDMKSLEITVNEPYIKELEEKGITPEESLNETLTHELTHFMKYPGSVLNVLRLQKSGQDLVQGHKLSELRTAFSEAQTNIYMTNEKKHPATAKIGKAQGLNEDDYFGRLMYGLYQEVSGQDFGIELNEEEKGLVDKLRELDFLDKNKETYNFRRFVKTLKDYQPPQNKDKQGKGKGKGSGEGKSQGRGSGKDDDNNEDDKQQGQHSCEGSGNGLEGFTDNQIREGLKQFAQECSTPEEYEEIVKQVLGEENKAVNYSKGYPQSTQGKGVGTEKGITQLAENFYTALAEKYTIPIRKKPLQKNGSLYPHSHNAFSISDPLNDIDAFSTPGILPGITKKWVRKEGEVHGEEEGIPDSFILIDNSGSMPSPIGQISIPVLGATAISNTYLHNNARVAVYNFGGNNYLLNPSKNKEEVHRTLRTYTGGGTVFNPKFLEAILKENTQEFDVSVISDMGISNLDAFVNSVLGIPKTHRVHLIYTENNPYVGQLRSNFGNRENVAVLPLTYEGDIQKITMGELKKSVR